MDISSYAQEIPYGPYVCAPTRQGKRGLLSNIAIYKAPQCRLFSCKCLEEDLAALVGCDFFFHGGINDHSFVLYLLGKAWGISAFSM